MAFSVFNRILMEDITEKVTFQQAFEGGEEASPSEILEDYYSKCR